MLSALNFNQLYQVPNSLMMVFVLYHVLKFMRNAEQQKADDIEEDIEAQIDDKLELEDGDEDEQEVQLKPEAEEVTKEIPVEQAEEPQQVEESNKQEVAPSEEPAEPA